MKKLGIVLIAAFIIAAAYFGYNYFLKTELINLHSTQSVYIKDLSDLEFNSDLIVVAEVLKGSVEHKTSDPASSDAITGYTETPIEITKVYYGDVKVGDKITVTEEYWTRQYPSGKKQIVAIENYSPSKPGNKYLFFLKKYDNSVEQYKGMYFIVGVEKGKYISNSNKNYSSEIDSLTNEELEIGSMDSASYKNLLKSVLEKYKDE